MDGLRNGQTTSSQPAALMDVNGPIAEFVHRFQSLSAHRDSHDNLIKVIPSRSPPEVPLPKCSALGPHRLLRVNRVHAAGRHHRPADHASKHGAGPGRRHEVKTRPAATGPAAGSVPGGCRAGQQLFKGSIADSLTDDLDPCSPSLRLQNNNPYVIVLIDGDCLLVSEMPTRRDTSMLVV